MNILLSAICGMTLIVLLGTLLLCFSLYSLNRNGEHQSELEAFIAEYIIDPLESYTFYQTKYAIIQWLLIGAILGIIIF